MHSIYAYIKEKMKYFHYPWIKILLKLYSLNYRRIFHNQTISFTFKSKVNVDMKIYNKDVHKEKL